MGFGVTLHWNFDDTVVTVDWYLPASNWKICQNGEFLFSLSVNSFPVVMHWNFEGIFTYQRFPKIVPISGIFINSPVKDPTVKFIRGIVTIRGEIAARCNGNAMIAQCAIELRLIIFVKFATIHFMGYEFRLKLILYLALKLIIRPPYRWRPCCLCCGAGGGGGEVGNKDFPSFVKNCPKHRPLTFH